MPLVEDCLLRVIGFRNLSFGVVNIPKELLALSALKKSGNLDLLTYGRSAVVLSMVPPMTCWMPELLLQFGGLNALFPARHCA